MPEDELWVSSRRKMVMSRCSLEKKWRKEIEIFNLTLRVF